MWSHWAFIFRIKGSTYFIKEPQWGAKFEGYVQDQPTENAFTFGLVITNVGIGDLVKEMFKVDEKKDMKIMDQNWLSQVTLCKYQIQFNDDQCLNIWVPKAEGW